MENESDWIMRQLHAFADGLGYVLAHGSKSGKTAIVFPQAQAEKLPHQAELADLIAKQQYAAGAQRLLKLQYALPEQDFMKLGVWFYDTLNQLNDDELKAGEFSRSSIVAGLKQLAELEL